MSSRGLQESMLRFDEDEVVGSQVWLDIQAFSGAGIAHSFQNLSEKRMMMRWVARGSNNRREQGQVFSSAAPVSGG
jgi:hypothetical protein